MNILLNTSSGEIGGAFDRFITAIKTSFATFSVVDAFDILFLAVVFFVLFRFFKGKKAGALLIGIVVCLVILIMAYALGMKGTYFIFAGVFEIGALALVIIFQPEIRDGLEKIGSGSINSIMNIGDSKKKKQEHIIAMENICTAVADFSRTKTGALIVISGTTNIDDVVHTGVAIDAKVSSYLLRNLFYNKAPLHDGAVVIDGAKISAAGCLLPLTRRQDIDGDLGTRHRAAIGMSESSDAIIIVVSEETGVISVAYDFEFKRDFTPDSLRSLLLQKWIREDQRSSKRRTLEK